MKKTLYVLIAITLIIVTGKFIHSNYTKWGQKVQPVNINGAIIKKPKNLISFNLNQGNNINYSDTNLHDKWSVLFFGYTTCPDICPTTLTKLSDMYKGLDSISKKHRPNIVFISIDPEHDADDQADKYAKYFNQNFVGLTGNQNQITELRNNLGVVAQKIALDPENAQNYIYDHSSTLFIINPRGQLQAILSGPHKTENMIKDYKAIINKFG